MFHTHITRTVVWVLKCKIFKRQCRSHAWFTDHSKLRQIIYKLVGFGMLFEENLINWCLLLSRFNAVGISSCHWRAHSGNEMIETAGWRSFKSPSDNLKSILVCKEFDTLRVALHYGELDGRLLLLDLV